ncbi:hypothetical protein [Chitinophaga varians]|uniref:hypothetical protein n=1 Tax=Chitinophaga varians TaxID=2202339 RepID=UPI00165FA1C9|nr:hypothetical protein [Chitinophaga varians]MBC9914061.1 hypothetical protein [Chitinophaga varians]
MDNYIRNSQILIENNWIEVEPMSFRHNIDKELEILFDTSDQIEIYKKGKRIGGFYIKDSDYLLQIIHGLTGGSI